METLFADTSFLLPIIIQEIQITKELKLWFEGLKGAQSC